MLFLNTQLFLTFLFVDRFEKFENVNILFGVKKEKSADYLHIFALIVLVILYRHSLMM